MLFEVQISSNNKILLLASLKKFPKKKESLNFKT
jgi:hypothetical protein